MSGRGFSAEGRRAIDGAAGAERAICSVRGGANGGRIGEGLLRQTPESESKEKSSCIGDIARLGGIGRG